MTSSGVTTEPRESGLPRDGQHDFDFAIGRWKFHLRRLRRPLTGSTEWIEFDGESEARPIWGGRANLDTLRVESAETGEVIEGLTLRLYNAETGAWSLYWANAKSGLSLPPTVGSFTADGRGEFYDHEELDGRPILVRYVWSEITPTSAHFEQAFSPDGGVTWETNWITDQTRVSE